MRAVSGSSLRRWRLRAGFSQKDLAFKARCHVQTVKYWERQEEVFGHAPDKFFEVLLDADVEPARFFPRARRGKAWSADAERGRFLSENDGARLCGAKTRQGRPCVAKALPGKCRCKHHGGLSTGPRTAEGRASISKAVAARWALRRGEMGTTPIQTHGTGQESRGPVLRE